MNKKIYLWNLLPIVISVIHVGNLLPEPFGGTLFNMFIGFRYLFFIASGIYYCRINYFFNKNSLPKAFLFSLLGLSFWWGIDVTLYFTVGYVDGIGTFLMLWIAIYNYIVLAFLWAIICIVYCCKRRNKDIPSEEKE